MIPFSSSAHFYEVNQREQISLIKNGASLHTFYFRSYHIITGHTPFSSGFVCITLETV